MTRSRLKQFFVSGLSLQEVFVSRRIISERDWETALNESERGDQLCKASPLSCLLPDSVRMEILRRIWQERDFESEAREWDSMAPVGREFGSPDYERLAELDNLACAAKGGLAAAREWLGTPNAELDGRTPEELAQTQDGFVRVKILLKPDFVREAEARMQGAPHFLSQEAWDDFASYDGPVVSGDPGVHLVRKLGKDGGSSDWTEQGGGDPNTHRPG